VVVHNIAYYSLLFCAEVEFIESCSLTEQVTVNCCWSLVSTGEKLNPFTADHVKALHFAILV